MFKNKTLFISLILSSLLLAGCFGSKETEVEPTVSQEQLVGKVWNCQQLFEREVFDEARITIEFMADGTIKGNGGCNNYTSTYTLAGNKISFGPIASTKKACGASMGEQEFTYFSFLGQIDTLKLEDDELELFAPGMKEPMQFTIGSGGLFW